MSNQEPIPQEWIKRYVDTLLQFAKGFDGAMRDSSLLRAQHAMDLVAAFRESCTKSLGNNGSKE